ncbi:MAG: (2Fe-2S) ferredoxin domain-containing protein [Anaerolineae bacterium]|nr:(2Fe-2S) ferredoxin domain-containing protein [Anaerolineae bacterium]
MPAEQGNRRLRVVLCRGEYCNLGRRADRLYKLLDAAVSDINAGYSFAERPVKLEIANCLSMCAVGPNCVVYPEGTAYHELDEQALQQLIETHLAHLETS